MKSVIFSAVVIITFASAEIAHAQTVTDVDGNVYNTVVIGDQLWMAENLRCSRWFDNTPISQIEDSASWADIYTNNTKTSAWCYPGGIAANEPVYGKLYNWYAASYACPAGWHLPTLAEFNHLADYLGGPLLAGGKLKAISPLWNEPNTEADNSSGFSGLPAGYRDYTGTYFWLQFTYTVGNYGWFWTSTENSVSGASYTWLTFGNGALNNSPINKEYAASVRCIADRMPTGTDELKNKPGILLFPNPATDIIYVKYPENKFQHIEIYNLLGKCLQRHSAVSDVIEIDISTLPPGMYSIRITGSNQAEYQNFIKQ